MPDRLAAQALPADNLVSLDEGFPNPGDLRIAIDASFHIWIIPGHHGTPALLQRITLGLGMVKGRKNASAGGRFQ